jgi:hypothetical protein
MSRIRLDHGLFSVSRTISQPFPALLSARSVPDLVDQAFGTAELGPPGTFGIDHPLPTFVLTHRRPSCRGPTPQDLMPSKGPVDPLADVRTRMLSEDGKHDFHSDDARAVTGPARFGRLPRLGYAFVAEVEDTPAVLREAQ